MVRKLTTLFLAMLFTTGLQAQQRKPQPDDPQTFYAQKVLKYRKMRNTGTSLTIAGTILSVTGLIIFSNSVSDSIYDESDLEESLGGAFCAVIGNAGIAAGIPLWIVGAKNYQKYNNELQKVSVRINVSRERQGLSLTYRF